MPLTHVIWDWNGTLLNDVELSASIVREMLSSRSLPLFDIHHYRRIFGFPIAGYLERAGFDLEKETLQKVGDEWFSRYEEHKGSAPLFPQTHAILRRLKASGLTQSVLSAYPHDALAAILEHHGLMRYFDSPQGLDTNYPVSKVEVGRKLLTTLRVNPEHCVMIGDTGHDAEVARELGLDALLVTHGHNCEERLIALGVDCVGDLEEAAQWVLRRMGAR